MNDFTAYSVVCSLIYLWFCIASVIAQIRESRDWYRAFKIARLSFGALAIGFVIKSWF